MDELEVQTGIARFDLHLFMEEMDGHLKGYFDYDTNLFESATIERLVGHFQTLLEGIVANPDQPIGQLPLLTAAEMHQLLVEWNDTKTDYPRDKCVHQLFEEQVERSPDAIAVVFEDQAVSYRELNSQANQLAHHLQKLGVGPEMLVGLCLERSIDMIVGLLGILKAGGAYLPLDPSYPKDRLGFILQDAKASISVSQRPLAALLPAANTRWVFLDKQDWQAGTPDLADQADLTAQVAPSQAAYVIYTSGSTGTPKGVVIQHHALSNHMHWLLSEFSMYSADRVLLKTPYSFDASIWEIFAPLLCGAQLVVAKPDGHKDPNYLVETINASHITVLQFSSIDLGLDATGTKSATLQKP